MNENEPSHLRTRRVLFLCTGNSARSIIAESLLNHNSDGRFVGYSAGSHPRGEVHPHTLDILLCKGHNIESLSSRSWDEFEVEDAPSIDFVFTVCDNVANEPCPVWPGRPVTAHWGLADPAGVEETEIEQLKLLKEPTTCSRSVSLRFWPFRLARLTAWNFVRDLKRYGTVGLERTENSF